MHIKAINVNELLDYYFSSLIKTTNENRHETHSHLTRSPLISKQI